MDSDDALPKASFGGFTGTPIESGDKNAEAVFGDYISMSRQTESVSLSVSTSSSGSVSGL